MADRFGRKPTLMVNILCYSIIELSCAFAPSLPWLLVLRALFGIAMGGVWGVGAALTFETLPKEGRGIFSGFCRRDMRLDICWLRQRLGCSFTGLDGEGCLLPERLRRCWSSLWSRRRGVSRVAGLKLASERWREKPPVLGLLTYRRLFCF
jgi:hypothetical protein